MKTQIKHFDLYGKRNHKYDFLLKNNINSINWNNLNPTEPNYFFTNKNFDEIEDYENGFKVDEMFITFGSGIKFRKDNLLIKNHFKKESVYEMLWDLNNLNNTEILSKYKFNETKDWILLEQRNNFISNDLINIFSIHYKPFDIRFTYYPLNRINKIIPRGDSRKGLVRNYLNKENLGLNLMRRLVDSELLSTVLITSNPIDLNFYRFQTYNFPLYLYSDQGEQGEIIEQERTPNLNPEIVNEISQKLNLTFTNEKEDTEGTFAPIDILDYIYALLHSPDYREKYKEFLKIDFPRVPYPKAETFWSLVKIGGQIRQLHLLESPDLDTYITKYPKQGDNIVEKPIYKYGNVYINDEQYFEGVPEVVWNFYIGGYQPAQKWLKDRKGRELDFNDIIHYQKMIKSLFETDRLMNEIDKIGVE